MIDNIKYNLKSHDKLTKYSARQANFLLSLQIFYIFSFLFWMDTDYRSTYYSLKQSY